jgi:hypothetical protein
MSRSHQRSRRNPAIVANELDYVKLVTYYVMP